MDDVVGYSFYVGETLLGRTLPEIGLTDTDLTSCIATPPADRWNKALDKNLRVAKILFKKQYLASGFKKPINSLQILCVKRLWQRIAVPIT